MREFKFRVWSIDDEEMIYPEKLNNAYIFGYTAGFSLLRYNPIGGVMEGVEHIVMQYTGLKDINGKGIYEGDILKVDGGLDDYYYVVEWVFAGFQLVTYKKPESNVLGRANAINNGYFEESDGVEVIGNIYENTELLNQE